MKKVLILSLCLLISVFAIADGKSEYEVKLKSGSFIPEVTTNFTEALQALPSEQGRTVLYRLIQFYQIPSARQKAALKASGVELIDYIPNKTYVCRIAQASQAERLKSANIRSIFPINGDSKLSPELSRSGFPAWAMVGNDIQLYVKYFSKTEAGALGNFIEAHGGSIQHRLQSIRTLIIQLPANKIQDLARHTAVQWIEAISAPHSPDDLSGASSSRSNSINTSYSLGRKYNGAGVVVAVCDDGVIGPHIDFEGRLTQHTADNSGNHGDMVSGIFFGAGNLNPLNHGMAPGAYMHIYRIGNISITGYPHILNGVANYNTLGTTVTSTSYSQGTGGVYNTDAEFTDQQTSQYASLIHMFSAGNSGTLDHGYGAGPGWGNISGGAKAGKNVICVGNLSDKDVLEVSSSRGPAADGRIKPDLCAQGAGQITTDAPNTYQVGSGTSAASPTVAGVVAQLFHAYKDLNAGNEPETGLLKACLLNTAEDLGNPGPDFQFGWGRINGLKAVRILEENRYIRDSITQGASNSHTISVPANVSQLRVMTYWTDPEGNPSASIALVNDINMQLVDPSSTTYNPWVLDHSPTVAALSSNATRGVDSLNNVEQVTLDNPAAGNYTVNLTGAAIPQGAQVYYVLYDFMYDGLELTYPIGGEGLVPGETEMIRWDAPSGSSPFTLEYSLDGGNTYNLISNTVPGADRFYEWTVPAALSSEAMIKVSRGGFSSESDTNFTIVPVPANLQILRVCPDTIEIAWNSVSGATLYEVSMLGNMYMDSIGTTASTSFNVTGLNPNQEHWFSVRSIVGNGEGRRAIAINQAPGTTNCVLDNDIEIVEFVFPTPGIIMACRDLSNSDIIVQINNLGLQPASNIQVNYQINNGPLFTETITGPLAAGSSLDYTFTTQADFSTPGTYAIHAWANWTSDQNQYNDSTQSTSEVVTGNMITAFPFAEGFNAFAACPTTTNCGLTNCSLQNGWINVDNASDFDDIDWRTDAGGTTSSLTGPSTDYDLGTATGNYLYLESSNGCDQQLATLLSPCIDLSSFDCANLEFGYHMYGSTMGELHVDILTKDSTIVDVINPVVGNQGNSWNLASVDLTPFAGDTINLRIRGITGNGFRSDMAVDGFSIEGSSQPNADFTFAQGVGDTLFFTNTSTGSIHTYAWDFGDSTSSSSANPSHLFSNPGTYNVTLIVSGDCGTDTLVQSVLITHVLQEIAADIEIYPNPNTGNFQVRLPGQLSNQELSFTLVNVLGQPVLKMEKENNASVLAIDASAIPEGVYFAVISGAGFSVTRKIVKY